MKYIHNNTYHNPTLRFSITKPEDWVFIPSGWALNLKTQSFEHTAEFEEMVNHVDLPFVHFYKYHADGDYPCPTVQCGCRLNEGSSLDDQLDEVTTDLVKYLPTSNILEATTQYILSGHRAIYLKFTFSVNTNVGTTLQCLGRSIIVPRRECVFTIGLTGSMEEKYRCDDEFAEIIHTIQIGR